MSTVIYLSNEDVKAVVGTGKGGNASIDRVCSGVAPTGSIINGMVMDEAVFTEFLWDFWEKNKLPKNDVVLVLGSAQSVTRLIQMPRMSYKKMMEYLPREFADVERTKEPVYACVKMSTEGAMQTVITTMVDRGFLEPHVQRFKKLGLKLKSIAMATMAEIQVLNQLSYLRDKTAIIQMLDSMSLLNILYVDGQYYQFSRNRVFGEHGTPAFGVESARTISNQQQFLKTQQAEQPITHVYLGGGLRESDFEVCRDSILQMDEGLDVEALHTEKGGKIRFEVSPAEGDFSHYITAIGGLLCVYDRSNMLYQYRHSPERMQKRRELNRILAPTVTTLALLTLIAIWQAFTWFSSVDTVNRQMDYMENPEVMSKVMEHDQLEAQNEQLSIRGAIINKTLANIKSYPVYTSSVKQALLESAAGLATIEINGFESELGIVSIEVFAQDAESVHQFINRMEERQELFDEIYYDGFDYDDRSGTWKTSVMCYLAGSDGEATS